MHRWRYLKSLMWFWFGLVWAVVGAVALIAGIVTSIEARRFAVDGVATQGVILEKREDRADEGGITYSLRYSFRDDFSVERKASADVNWDVWSRYDVGDAAPVRYLRYNPQRSRIDDGDALWIGPAVSAGLGVLFLPIGAWITIRAW